MTSSIEATSSANSNKVTVDDLGSEEAFLAAIDETIKYFNDGDIVEGTVVKVDRDEVLLDIGYKSEGVIPSRELSIRNDVDPNEIVSLGDKIEALVLTKEDKEGRLEPGATVAMAAFGAGFVWGAGVIGWKERTDVCA